MAWPWQDRSKRKAPKKTYFIPKLSIHDFELSFCDKKTVKKEKRKVGSRGEVAISDYLDSRRIAYKREYVFRECINRLTGENMVFDFYLPSKNMCIEFDGRQHFFESKQFHGDKASIKLFEQKDRDAQKNMFCEEKSIVLIRIKYNQYNLIAKILGEAIP